MTQKEIKSEMKKLLSSEFWAWVEGSIVIPSIEMANMKCVNERSSTEEVRVAQGAYNALRNLREDFINVTLLPDEEEKEREDE